MAPFLFVTDLHGSRAKYERTLSLARETGARLVINGGDLLPHGRKEGDQARFLREFLDPHLAAYQAEGIRYFLLPGNDDIAANDPLLEEICARHSLARNLAQRKEEALGFEFLGLSWVTDFPFRLKDRARRDSADYAFQPQFGDAILSRPGGWTQIPDWPAYAATLPSIEEELAALPPPADPGKAVYVIHGPPAGLSLDVVGGGHRVGSEATLRFIDRVQPRLTLHGHIHESPDVGGAWKAARGRTVCIQPGQSVAGLTVVEGDLAGMEFSRRILPVES